MFVTSVFKPTRTPPTVLPLSRLPNKQIRSQLTPLLTRFSYQHFKKPTYLKNGKLNFNYKTIDAPLFNVYKTKYTEIRLNLTPVKLISIRKNKTSRFNFYNIKTKCKFNPSRSLPTFISKTTSNRTLGNLRQWPVLNFPTLNIFLLLSNASPMAISRHLPHSMKKYLFSFQFKNRIPLSSLFNFENSFKEFPTLSNSISLPKHTYTNTTPNETYIPFSVDRIKFKPGYSRIWRQARMEFKKSWHLKFQYQLPLTKFILKFKRFHQFQYGLHIAFRLDLILSSSHIVPSLTAALTLINLNVIFINGHINNNPFFILHKNDLIQLPINLSPIFTQINFQLLNEKRMKFLSKAKFRIIASKTIPFNSIQSLALPYFDIPRQIEVDFLSSSIFVLNSDWGDPTQVSPHLFQTNTSILNMYNWKYLT